MKKEEMKYLLLDLETAPDRRRADMISLIKPIVSYEEYAAEMRAKYTKEDTIQKHIAEYSGLKAKQELKYQKLAKDPRNAMIKLLKLKTRDKYWILENQGLLETREKQIIQIAVDIIQSHVIGRDTLGAHELGSFNGKFFDVPILNERGEILGVEMEHRFFEDLTSRTYRASSHYDMIERRPFKDSIVNKLSLSDNLVVRFGHKFAKKDIDFNSCTFKELKRYSIDEDFKLEYWYLNHNNIKMINPENFLQSLKNYTTDIMAMKTSDKPIDCSAFAKAIRL